MKLTGNTIFITGGGSGIGRGLAEAFQRLGNTVIIAGRRQSHLDAVLAVNPGMDALQLDIADPASISKVSETLLAKYPKLNVLINNAGIMQTDAVAGIIDDAKMVSTITTNLMGPIRMTSALIEHLKDQPDSVIAYTSSVLGFVPMAMTGVYSATKAALHSYILSQRFMLKNTSVRILEIAPPWVRTELMNSQEAELAMPLDQFIMETFAILGSDADEILTNAAKPLRANAGTGEHAFVNDFNAEMMKVFEQASAKD